jgi:leishmanolysin
MPNVRDRARAHFGCPALDGVELENFEGQTSHWESRVMGNELMTLFPSAKDRVASAITFAMFRDMGWYAVDWA